MSAICDSVTMECMLLMMIMIMIMMMMMILIIIIIIMIIIIIIIIIIVIIIIVIIIIVNSQSVILVVYRQDGVIYKCVRKIIRVGYHVKRCTCTTVCTAVYRNSDIIILTTYNFLKCKSHICHLELKDHT